MTSPASSMFLLTPPLFEANSREHIILSLQCKVYFKKQSQYYHYISRGRVINYISNQCSKFQSSSKWPTFSCVFVCCFYLVCVHLKWESAKFKHRIGSSISYFSLNVQVLPSSLFQSWFCWNADMAYSSCSLNIFLCSRILSWRSPGICIFF